ncbi:hypothetical protein PSHT_15468 [Puccinia striiformis]|uniref:Uncharacterized protein n=1 Tax=Puccinia striiformis TaxID=27350 RepID=A0A2S4UF20_9BASI|nr:hypothetical protein PSHT_15468 [Puccinia striiformis]
MPSSRKQKKKNPTSLESLAVSSPINRSNQLNQDNSETNEGNGDEHSPGKLMTPNSTQAPPTDEEELQRARAIRCTRHPQAINSTRQARSANDCLSMQVMWTAHQSANIRLFV